jgi:hypothetical protein
VVAGFLPEQIEWVADGKQKGVKTGFAAGITALYAALFAAVFVKEHSTMLPNGV